MPPHDPVPMTASIKKRLRAWYMGADVRRLPVGIAAGLRMEVDPNAPIHIYLGIAEIEIARHIRRLATPGCRCFDIGGHNAYYAMVLARLTAQPVTSFDFDPVGIARMRRNLALNPQIAPLVQVQELYVSFETNAAVNADTLDAFIARQRAPSPGLIKIDVEGAEAGVLHGARELLQSRPHLVIETHGAEVERECVDILTPFGYRPLIVTQRRWLREHRPADNRWLIAEGQPTAMRQSTAPHATAQAATSGSRLH